MILFQEDLANNQSEYVNRLCDHFNLPIIEPQDSLKKNINTASISSYPHLASIGQSFADMLRSKDLYFLVNFAKQIGLKSFFFGQTEANIPKINLEERRFILDQLAKDINELVYFFQIDVSGWRVN